MMGCSWGVVVADNARCVAALEGGLVREVLDDRVGLMPFGVLPPWRPVREEDEVFNGGRLGEDSRETWGEFVAEGVGVYLREDCTDDVDASRVSFRGGVAVRSLLVVVSTGSAIFGRSGQGLESLELRRHLPERLRPASCCEGGLVPTIRITSWVRSSSRRQ